MHNPAIYLDQLLSAGKHHGKHLEKGELDWAMPPVTVLVCFQVPFLSMVCETASQEQDQHQGARRKTHLGSVSLRKDGTPYPAQGTAVMWRDFTRLGMGRWPQAEQHIFRLQVSASTGMAA
jgi:hypothetical protein